MRLLLVVGLLLGALCAPHGRAATTELFGGALGGWLREQAIPELTTLLGKHPRFKGERIRVVAMADGQPATASDRLTQSIREQLTHRLTRIKGLKLAWRETTTRCGVPRETPYLLGVEVIRESSSKHLVRVAMVDVEEGVWVSGAHLQWRGGLTQQERRALAQPVVDAPAGTIDQPLPATQRTAVVEQLLSRIECSLRGGLEGSVYVGAADAQDPLLTTLAADMRQKLTQSALLELAEKPEGADWLLTLSAGQDVGDSVLATLITPQDLSSAASANSSGQRLAAVYVDRAGVRSSPGRQVAQADSRIVDRTPLIEPELLIEGLREVALSAGDQCFARSARCTEVEFELAAPSYLLVLRTRANGGVNLGHCAQPKRTAGLKRFRLSLHDGGAGFYAIATTDAQLAKQLHETLVVGSDNCADRPAPGWLDELAALIDRTQGQIDWHPYFVGDRQAEGATAVASRWQERQE